MADDLTHTAGTGGSVVVETSAPPASPPGYELRDEIGRGGMGVVYEAVHETIGQRAAVKVLSPRLSQDERALSRFYREARALSRADPPSHRARQQRSPNAKNAHRAYGWHHRQNTGA